jgi:hypothetical protein
MKRKCFSTIFGSWEHEGIFVSEKVTRKRDSRVRDDATPRTPKTPVFGLPKSRPSPLQKTPFFALSEAKSVHF